MISVSFKGSEIANAKLIRTEGLDASCAEDSMVEYSHLDGGRIAGLRLSIRTIRLIYSIASADAESARSEIMGLYEPKSKGILRVKTSVKDISVEAHVGAVDYDLWAMGQEVTVTLYCPDPWLYATESVTLEPASTTQWTVRVNRGVSVGFVAQVKPSGYVRIVGEDARLEWSIPATVLPSTSVLTLDTREGHRDLYLESEGVRTSYVEYITAWDWLQIPHIISTAVGIRGTVVAGNLEYRERWAGL